MFLARRTPAAGEEGSVATMWQFAQGGVDKVKNGDGDKKSEELEVAARRELWEETGVKSATLLSELPMWLCCA